MEKKMNVTGMMCKHCEARAKKALEAVEGVVCAAPDHDKNEIIVTLSAEVADSVLAAAVTGAGYQVNGIE